MNAPMNLRWLRSFTAVMEHGSMAAAAAELGYVPSAITQHIAGLERALGVELLVRRPGSRIAITAGGRALLAATGPLLIANSEFSDSLRSISRSEAPDLTLGTHGTALQYLLPRVFSSLQKDPSWPRVNVREMETPDAIPLVRSGALDLLVGYRYLPADSPLADDPLTVTLVHREPMLLVAAPEAGLTFEELVDKDWALGHRSLGDRRLLGSWSERLRFRFHVAFESSDPNCLLTLASEGLAVSVVPATVVAAGLERGLRVQIVPPPAGIEPWHREILVVTRPSFQPPFLPGFIEGLRAGLDAAERTIETSRQG